MYIDSHCHINFPELNKNIDSVLSNMKEKSITHALCVSVTLDNFQSVPKLDNIPANVLGYAATFGWLLTELIAIEAILASDGGSILEISMGHPFVLMVISFIGGAIMAKLSEMLASKLG